tara:strand:- start:101 stop:418 length:318 start_codon:yes stop_codon:yes gene_type:complete
MPIHKFEGINSKYDFDYSWVGGLDEFEKIVEIRKQNNENKLFSYIILGKEYCRFCKKAQELAKKSNLKFEYFDLDDIDIPSHLYHIIPGDYPYIPQIIQCSRIIR